MEYTGEVIHIYDEITFASGFSKRDLVLSDKSEQYPQEVPFTFMKDNCAKLNDIRLGDVVTISFDLQGREYGGRHYLTARGWKLEVQHSNENAREGVQNRAEGVEPVQSGTDTASDQETGDIPF